MATTRVGPRALTKLPDREESLGAWVRNRRKTEGLTQRQLAELAGVGPRVIWELEHDKPTLRMDVVNAVLHVFGQALGAVAMTRPAKDE